jgi:mannose/fructose-specific phosphotransferase system component IIA
VRINDGSGVIVFTDVFVATPSRIALALHEPNRVRVIAGVNLPILIKALGNRRGPLEDVLVSLVQSGQNAIQVIAPEVPGKAGEHESS